MTAVGFEAERWYADKGRRALALERLDALRELAVVRVQFDDGAALYTLMPERPEWEVLLAQAEGAFSYDGAVPQGRPEPLAVDQSHSSWRVGGAHVKCYRRLVPGAHPEVELLATLSTRGFAHAPAYLGSLSWHAPRGERFTLAVVQEFVEDGEEGWEWASALASAGDASFAGEIGAITRQLHEALTDALPSRGATAADTDVWSDEAHAQLERALEVEPSLAAVADRARRELARLVKPGEAPLLARVHGDLHVGQFLRTRDRFVIVDFEGQPAKSVEQRRALDTPLRDLASLARSLDHCGRYAVRRRGADAERTETWIAEARKRLVDGYGGCDRALLRALEWERALYEFTYAATYLPEWIYAPRGGLDALLDEPES